MVNSSVGLSAEPGNDARRVGKSLDAPPFGALHPVHLPQKTHDPPAAGTVAQMDHRGNLHFGAPAENVVLTDTLPAEVILVDGAVDRVTQVAASRQAGFIMVLRITAANLKRLPERFKNVLRGRMGVLTNEAMTKLTTVPGPSKKPIRWSSERQRRGVFATDGFGGGIPTRRSNAIVNAWQVELTEGTDSAVLKLSNDNPGMPFVQGEFQQPFHADTGWIKVDDVADDFLRDGGDAVIKTWLEMADGL